MTLPTFPDLGFMNWPPPGELLTDQVRHTREADRERRFEQITRTVFEGAESERTSAHQEFELLMKYLPGWLQEACRMYEHELEEIKLDINCRAVLSLRGHEIFLPNILTFNDITHITTGLAPVMQSSG